VKFFSKNNPNEPHKTTENMKTLKNLKKHLPGTRRSLSLAILLAFTAHLHAAAPTTVIRSQNIQAGADESVVYSNVTDDTEIIRFILNKPDQHKAYINPPSSLNGAPRANWTPEEQVKLENCAPTAQSYLYNVIAGEMPPWEAFVVQIKGTLISCGGGPGGGGSGPDTFTYTLKQENGIWIDPESQVTGVGTWVKLMAKDQLTDGAVDVNWSVLGENAEHVILSEGEPWAPLGENETKNSVWFKTSSYGSITIKAQRILEGVSTYSTAIININFVNLTIDSNYDGMINEADDPIKLTAGGLVRVNDDDDNDNGIPDKDETGTVAGENDLVPIKLWIDPSSANSAGTLTLSAVSGGAKIRVWESATKGAQVVLPKTWTIGTDTVPEILYLEGIEASAAVRDVELRLRYVPDEGEVDFDDRIKLTVFKVVSNTLKSAADGTTPNNRTTVGVCEKVTFSMVPAMNVTWNADDAEDGTPVTGFGTTFNWTAPETENNNISITATIGTIEGRITFNANCVCT